jgi:hypothetical protein
MLRKIMTDLALRGGRVVSARDMMRLIVCILAKITARPEYLPP